MEHKILIPNDEYWFCALAIPILSASFLCSTSLIVNMTFERFYSITRPHKAASFNTVKRAKITIACIVILSILYNIPFGFITVFDNWQCLPYGRSMGEKYGIAYYWSNFVLNFALPFTLLLTMNSVIIYTIRTRSTLMCKRNEEEVTQGKNSKTKKSETQIFAILLLVTFGFLILITPAYCHQLYMMYVNFYDTPKIYAGYYMSYNITQKLYFTNHGVNFFLYVISGHKFRQDLVNLFKRKRLPSSSMVSFVSENTSIQNQ